MATQATYSRSEKSLSALTKKFVEMLQSGETLDLNIVSDSGFGLFLLIDNEFDAFG